MESAGLQKCLATEANARRCSSLLRSASCAVAAVQLWLLFHHSSCFCFTLNQVASRRTCSAPHVCPA